MKNIYGFILSSFLLFSVFINAENQVEDIFVNRHSGKSYDPSKFVSQDQMMAMIEAARWAPSSHNDQPWNFIVCDRQQTPEAYAKALNTLKGTQQAWAKDAPVLIIVAARMQTLYKNKPNEWAEYDTGAAAISMSLQATALGLMTHQIGGFDKAAIAREFQLPDNCKPLTIMIVGYESAEPDTVVKPRERRSIGDNFFIGEWGSGITQ